MCANAINVCDKIQDGLTYIEVVPFIGVIGSALRVIFSLGELFAGRLIRNEDLIGGAKIGLIVGSANFFSCGLFVPIFAVIMACNGKDSFTFFRKTSY